MYENKFIIKNKNSIFIIHKKYLIQIIYLQKVTDFDLSNQAFGFMNSKMIKIKDISLRATRITYVGELGWELYIPVKDGLSIWLALLDAGSDLGIRPCGYRAIESLRLEKGYRAWAGEINSETNP